MLTYRAEVIHAQEGRSGHYQASLLQVEEVTFQTVLHTRGRVQLAIDCIHSSYRLDHMEHGCALNRVNGHLKFTRRRHKLALFCRFRDGEHNG